ncbi:MULTISPECIES: MucR family transcriptional regulator [unclassified Sphingomonas]|uniref:MucR family transcriptional regulator n=1 Tax=unclassified Sphingomonas TaxID=196159 RepID=UPI0009E75010|nr:MULTISPECIES: MucR family transcriptional regulator [unclassified Sphingomonas]
MSNDAQADLLTLTTEIVATHVMHNSVSANDVATLIRTVHAALAGLGAAPEPVETVQSPAVTVRTSVKPDHIVCLEDGKKMKMLKRHLTTDHGMTPADYRAKWKLPADYPMVAPNYAATRRALAVKIGLGRKKGDTVAKPAVAAKPARKSLKLKLDDA